MTKTTFARIEEQFMPVRQGSTDDYDNQFKQWAAERGINVTALLGETICPGQCNQSTGTSYYEGGDQQTDTVFDQIYDDR